MHETGIVRDLVKRLEAVAAAEGADRITAANIWLGALSQFSADHFREHFRDESRGTRAEGAVLRIVLSDDFAHRDAQAVLLRDVELAIPGERNIRDDNETNPY